MNGVSIPKVLNTKFLGVILDEYLDWTLPIKLIFAKVAAGNYSLRMIKNILPLKSRLAVYFCNVQSHLTYALSAWGPMLKHDALKRLKKIQNNSIRTIYDISRRERMNIFLQKSQCFNSGRANKSLSFESN